MPTILSLSSQVAHGHVGHSATVFAWQRLGIEVIALPTVILSNRPDLPHRAGERLPPDKLGEMVAAIEANGRLEAIDGVFTGYLPSAGHAAFAAGLVERLRTAAPGLLYCCDPILGDEPDGLYIARDAAETIRARLLPLADIVTPNRFELGWLTGRDIASTADVLAAARDLGCVTLATSSPGADGGELANLLYADGRAWEAAVKRRAAVPHGTGDVMAALFFGFLLRSRTAPDALALATGGLEAIIEASEGKDELELIASQDFWSLPAPWPLTALR